LSAAFDQLSLGRSESVTSLGNAAPRAGDNKVSSSGHNSTTGSTGNNNSSGNSKPLREVVKGRDTREKDKHSTTGGTHGSTLGHTHGHTTSATATVAVGGHPPSAGAGRGSKSTAPTGPTAAGTAAAVGAVSGTVTVAGTLGSAGATTASISGGGGGDRSCSQSPATLPISQEGITNISTSTIENRPVHLYLATASNIGGLGRAVLVLANLPPSGCFRFDGLHPGRCNTFPMRKNEEHAESF
jgi:hypothetical protein